MLTYTRQTPIQQPLFQDYLGKAPETIWILMKQEMTGWAVTSAGPHANDLHLAPDR